MEVSNESANFGLLNHQPSSPPATPNSSQLKNISGTSYMSMGRRKRYGVVNLELSPPDHSGPRDLGYGSSYTPSDKNSPSDNSDLDEIEDDTGIGNEALYEAKSEATSEADSENSTAAEQTGTPDLDLRHRRASVVLVLEIDTDITVEEVSDNDIAYDDLAVIRPDQTEDAASDTGSADLLDALKKLHCGAEAEREKARHFETMQKQKYAKKKKRWSKGGYGKRSIAESIGSQSSDDADIEPLDDTHRPGSSTRRLRRRTQGPEDSERPNRGSLLLVEPPKELEEIVALEIPPPLISDSDGDLWSDEEGEDEDDEDDNDDDDDDDEIERLLPTWLMEVESNPPSRPSTPISVSSHSDASILALGTE